MSSAPAERTSPTASICAAAAASLAARAMLCAIAVACTSRVPDHPGSEDLAGAATPPAPPSEPRLVRPAPPEQTLCPAESGPPCIAQTVPSTGDGCQLLRDGGTLLTGVTLAAGAATGTCAAQGGASVIVTAGVSSVVVAPACLTLATGTAAAGLGATALHGATLVCQHQTLFLHALERVEASITRVVYQGIAYELPCPDAHYATYRHLKSIYCHAERGHGCYHDDDCPTLKTKTENAQTCLNARKQIQACWGAHADEGHRQALRDAERRLKRCQRLWDRSCGNG